MRCLRSAQHSYAPQHTVLAVALVAVSIVPRLLASSDKVEGKRVSPPMSVDGNISILNGNGLAVYLVFVEMRFQCLELHDSNYAKSASACERDFIVQVKCTRRRSLSLR